LPGGTEERHEEMQVGIADDRAEIQAKRFQNIFVQHSAAQEFCSVGDSTNSTEDRGQRERGSGGGSPLVKGCGGSCNLVQELSFHIVKVS